MTDINDQPKILEGGPVTFGPSNAKADTLENIIVDGKPAQSVGTNNFNTDDFEEKAFDLISNDYELLLNFYSHKIPDHYAKNLKCLVPYGIKICLKKTASNVIDGYKIDLLPISKNDFKKCLIKIYGNYVLESDLCDGLSETVELEKMPIYDELKVINPNTLSQKQNRIETLWSPFLSILMLEPKYRPFAAGAVLYAVENKKYGDVDLSNGSSLLAQYEIGKLFTEFPEPLNFGDILNYAKKKKLKEVTEVYCAVKKLPLFTK